MPLEIGIRFWRWGNAIACLGVLQFLVFATLAMNAYPGGTRDDAHTDGYLFFENYLSDLGRTQAWSGDDNTASALRFNTSIIVLGATLVPFFVFLPTHAPDRRFTLAAAACFGVISAIALIGLGRTPYDINSTGHHTALFVWVTSLSVAMLLHFWALLQSEESSDVFAFLSLGVAILIGVYIVRGIDIVAAAKLGGERPELIESVMMQKWVVLAIVTWYVVFGLRMVLTTQLPSVNHNADLDRAAEKYAERLTRRSGGRRQ